MSSRILTEEDAIITEAIDRAKLAMKNKNADYSVGFCEGVINLKSRSFTSAWCAIISREGNVYLGGGGRIQLTSSLLKKVKDGEIVEHEVEEFIQSVDPTIFDTLVKYALNLLKSQRD